MKTPKEWRELKRHPISAEYRDLTGAKWEAFVAKMRVVGFLVTFPIIIVGDEVIDGWQRLRACIELDLQPTFSTLPADIDIETYVEAVNDQRRHETSDERRERIERVAERRKSGESIRTIAASEGQSVAQTQRDLEAANSGVPGGGTPENENPADPPKTTGKDGKKYPAKTKKLCPSCTHRAEVGKPKIDKCPDCKELNKKSPKVKPKPPETPSTREPGEEVEQVTDTVGFVVPFKALIAFDDAKIIGKICTDIDGLVARVEAVGKSPGGRMLHTTSQTQTLQQVRKSLWGGRATHVCPYCRGEGKCDPCKSSGWLDRVSWKNSPEGLRKEMEV